MTDQIIRKPEVIRLTGLPHSTLYKMIRSGAFPSPIKITGGRASGWVLAEVQAYIAKCIENTRHTALSAHKNKGGEHDQ
jgi:prophage regulatory protein